MRKSILQFHSLWSASGQSITAPPEPSAQTPFMIDAISDQEHRHEERWEHILNSLNLLFARVFNIGTAQQELQDKVNHTMKTLEPYAVEQQLLQKQVEATGQAMARLTVNQFSE
jgi:hypothetical protein